MPVVPTTETMSATTARRRLDPAGARAFERDLADRVALQHHGVERRPRRRRAGGGRRRTPGRRGRRRGRRRASRAPISLTCMSSARAAATCSRVTRSMPSHLDPFERRRGSRTRRSRGSPSSPPRRARPRRRSGRPRRSRAAAPRRAPRRRTAPVLHRREDEVRRPVDDPEHAVDVRDDERLAQHLDHRDRRADARPRSGAGRPPAAAASNSSAPRRATSCLFAVTTGRPEREQLEHVLAGRLDAAHHLGHDRTDGSSRISREVRR